MPSPAAKLKDKEERSTGGGGDQPNLQCLATPSGLPIAISSNISPAGRKTQKYLAEGPGGGAKAERGKKGQHFHKELLARERYDYEPLYLESSKMGLGKFKTVISLEGYRVSFMPYVPASRLKEELNEEQRKKFPHID